MGKPHQILRRESRCPMADFFQRIRVGLIGAGLILLISGVIRWIMH